MIYLGSETISESTEKFYFGLKFSESIMNVLVFNDGFAKHLSLFRVLKKELSLEVGQEFTDKLSAIIVTTPKRQPLPR